MAHLLYQSIASLLKMLYLIFPEFLLVGPCIHDLMSILICSSNKNRKLFYFFFVHTMHLVGCSEVSWRWQKLPQDGQLDVSPRP